MEQPCRVSVLTKTAFLFLCLALTRTCAMAESPAPAGKWDAARADQARLEDLSGNGGAAQLHGVTVMKKVEDLVERPCMYFDGKGACAEIANNPGLNSEHVSLVVWFKVEAGTLESQVPLVLKSLTAHVQPWYQYGVFLMDTPEHPRSVSFYAGIGNKSHFVEALNVDLYAGWMCVAATFDGSSMRLYCNGKQAAIAENLSGRISACDTPLIVGAYGNLPKTPPNCFCGYVSVVEVYDSALSAPEVRTQYEHEKGEYPEPSVAGGDRDTSDYAKNLNEALRDPRDIWAERLIARGGATYDNIKNYLRPLFFSTGFTNETLGVHNLLFGEDGGNPPYVIPFADGSRIAANVYQDPHYIEWWIGPNGDERYGSDLARLEGPALDDGWHPILETAYTDAAGVHYSQECFAARIPELDHLVAFVKFTVEKRGSKESRVALKLKSGKNPEGLFKATGTWKANGNELAHELDLTDATAREVYAVWTPKSTLPSGMAIDAAVYGNARRACTEYWNAALARGNLFDVPEPLVMDVQRNLLIQNLIMRWKYSLGAVVYHDSYFQPESNDTMSVLGMYGFTTEYGDAVRNLANLSKGEQYYSNWERGEKLSHAAHYYFLTRDKALLEELTPRYAEFCQQLKNQIAADPHGILRKQRHCGDIPTEAYCTFHQAVCWRGMRDMAEVWSTIGRNELASEYRTVASNFRQSLLNVVQQSQKTLDDGTLFVPSMLLDEKAVYDPITETRIGSYWNLCMPYAFASGLWNPAGPDMRNILDFMHNHGAVLLGLIRFNYYPVPIGTWRTKGLPGYYTTGYDNVYVPSYLRMLADTDEADRMVVTFYAKLAHGQTRGTFVSGEGETLGTRPPEFYRSCYGTPCSANNSVFLLALRLMLLRESYDNETGIPDGLFLAHATPREWLEDGKRIVVKNSPTCFGPITYTIASHLNEARVDVDLDLPDRNPAKALLLKLRVPTKMKLLSVTLNGNPYERFDSDKEVIDLSKSGGRMKITARYQ